MVISILLIIHRNKYFAKYFLSAGKIKYFSAAFPTFENIKLSCSLISSSASSELSNHFALICVYFQGWSISIPDNKPFNFSQNKSQVPLFLFLFLEVPFHSLNEGSRWSIENSFQPLNGRQNSTTIRKN